MPTTRTIPPRQRRADGRQHGRPARCCRLPPPPCGVIHVLSGLELGFGLHRSLARALDDGAGGHDLGLGRLDDGFAFPAGEDVPRRTQEDRIVVLGVLGQAAQPVDLLLGSPRVPGIRASCSGTSAETASAEIEWLLAAGFTRRGTAFSLVLRCRRLRHRRVSGHGLPHPRARAGTVARQRPASAAVSDRSLASGWRRRSSRSAAMAIRRVGSVSASHWRRVSCASASVPARLSALPSMARHIPASA